MPVKFFAHFVAMVIMEGSAGKDLQSSERLVLGRSLVQTWCVPVLDNFREKQDGGQEGQLLFAPWAACATGTSG